MRKATAGALLLFVVLSLVLTYPLALHLAGAVEDRQDALLNVWITAWDGHQLLSDPLHLFDANIFHTYPRTLAYSELLLGNALLALPLTAVAGNPVLGYNIALLLSFVLSGFGTYLLVLRLTRSVAGGLVSGLIFAFSSFHLTNLAQAQLLTSQWLPFALLSLYQLLRQPRLRHAVTFVLFFCLQSLSSFYYAILLALTVFGFVIFDFALRIWSHITQHASPVTRQSPWPHLLLAACCITLIMLPFALPYFQVQRELGFERTLADSEPFSASLRQYLMVPPGSAIHGRWLPSDETPIAGGYPVDALFPGLAALALALWGLIRGQGRTRWFFLLLLLAAWLLSLGPRLYLAPGQPSDLNITLPYAWLYALVPGFKALRAPVRFDALVMLSLAVLAGYGVASLQRSIQRALDSKGYKYAGLVLVACLLMFILLESLVWPAAHAEPVLVGDEVPLVYRWLAGQAGTGMETGPTRTEGRWAIVELPMAFTPGGPRLEYQYLSTYHWHTTPDGYSGFIPPKHGQIVFEMESFPSERSLSLLQALDVRYVVVHTDRYPTGRWSAMQAALAQGGDLTPVGAFGPDEVYEVQPRSFEPEDMEVRGYLPPRAVAGQPYTAYLIAVNNGPRSYAVQPTELIRATAVWETAAGGASPADESPIEADAPLVTSPEGGAAVIPLHLPAPSQPGTYRLTIAEQDGPMGSWQLDDTVEVGDEGDADVRAGALPVPAQLASWTVPPMANPGQPLPIDLAWRALGKIDAYYSVYVKLIDAEGNAVAGWDGQPRDGEAPTLLWLPGETIDDTVTLQLPADAPAGDYTVEAGMYRAEDLVPVLTLNGNGIPVERVLLGTVRIEE